MAAGINGVRAHSMIAGKELQESGGYHRRQQKGGVAALRVRCARSGSYGGRQKVCMNEGGVRTHTLPRSCWALPIGGSLFLE